MNKTPNRWGKDFDPQEEYIGDGVRFETDGEESNREKKKEIKKKGKGRIRSLLGF